MTRYSIASCSVLAAVLVMCGCEKPAASSGAFKAEYRMQVNVGPRTAWGMGAAKFAELVREKTGGRVNIKPYYNSELLRGAQLLAAQMVARGNVDCALESTINISPVLPGMNVFVLPFVIRTYERMDRLESGETGRLLFEQMRSKGLEPLAWGENGFRQLTNSRKAVRTPDDLRGLRVRVVGSPIFVDIFRIMGADPINMNWGDAITAFQQGTVDGQENPLAILLSAQIYDYHRHVTLWNYVCDPLVLYWCKQEWDAFTPDVQEAIRAAAQEACVFEKALTRVGLDGGEAARVLSERFGWTPEVADPVAFLREKGMEVTTPSEEELALFRAATRPIAEKWKGLIGRDVAGAAARDLGEEL
jgi:tripartite ATP-independent transporter DctP family solute receptor